MAHGIDPSETPTTETSNWKRRKSDGMEKEH
jgi:hypothetical protein